MNINSIFDVPVIGRYYLVWVICMIFKMLQAFTGLCVKQFYPIIHFIIYLHQSIIVMDIRKIEKISKALSDPTRLCILQKLREQENCLYCTNIPDFVSLAQPSISHHLKQLVDAELILPSKEGRNVKFRLNASVLDEYMQFLSTLKPSSDQEITR